MNHTRTALITGASRGIGAAIATELSRRGHRVFGLARWTTACNEATDENITRITIDLSDLDATTRTVRELCKQHPIDTVVLNAGRGDIAPLENISSASIGHSLMFNLASPLIVARESLSCLRRATRADMIFIGSESALQGGRQGSLYSAAKFGLRGAAQALRQELSGANVHVGIVQPGMTRTGFFDELHFAPGADEAHALHAEDVADVVMGMLNSDDRAIVDEVVVRPRQHVVRSAP